MKKLAALLMVLALACFSPVLTGCGGGGEGTGGGEQAPASEGTGGEGAGGEGAGQ